MNKYDILGVVGEGAYGIVLKVKHKQTGEILAIKKFKETEDDEIVRKNTQREVKMLRMLKHENIVDLKEAFKRKNRIYLVFEYVDKNLLEVLEESPNGLDAEYIRKIIYQLVKSIEFCHRHQVLHRDIKPENLLVNRDGSLKICDFGFARLIPERQDDYPLTDYVATRWYRAPELVLSKPDYSKQVDMWAIACIMGELIDGNPLFPGDNEVDQLYLIQKMLGPLTQEQQELFLRNPRYQGIKFPEILNPETLERKYLGKISKQGLSFMKSILKMDQTQRLTAIQALRHPYFEGLYEKAQFQNIQDDENNKENISLAKNPNTASSKALACILKKLYL